MATIVTCQCGARVQLPEQTGGRVFRCPKCKVECLTTVDAKVIAATQAQAGAEAVCPICQSHIAEAEAILTCPHCQQVHHRECWVEVGGCSTYGCEQAPAMSKEPAPAARPLTAWGDTKNCPACGEKIKSIALRCRYCGTDFDTVDPLTVADLRKGVRKADRLRSIKSTVIGLFIMSVIGCLAPLVVILCLILIVPKHQLLGRAGPVYLVLGYSALALSVIYSLLMLFFLIH